MVSRTGRGQEQFEVAEPVPRSSFGQLAFLTGSVYVVIWVSVNAVRYSLLYSLCIRSFRQSILSLRVPDWVHVNLG